MTVHSPLPFTLQGASSAPVVLDLDEAEPRDVSEIYRHLRAGRCVVAVVPDRAVLLASLLESGIFATSSDSVDAGSLFAALTRAPVVIIEGDASVGSLVSLRLGTSATTPRRATTGVATRVTLLGLGTVGYGVYCRLAAVSGLSVAACAVRDLERHRRQVPAGLLHDDPFAALQVPSEIVVEVIGGIEPARSLVREAIESGRHVVTANKRLIADSGAELQRLAGDRGVELHYSAAVGGSVPVLESIDQVASASPIASVRGILSGTANFVLSALGRGADFADAVAEAQRRGLAEKDPARDLSGVDTAEKLALLARRAFGLPVGVAEIDIAGIEAIGASEVRAAATRKRVISLVASCRRRPGGIEAVVGPVELTADDALCGAENEENRVVIETVSGDSRMLRGLGAGRWPTTAAVFADISTIAATAAQAGAQR